MKTRFTKAFIALIMTLMSLPMMGQDCLVLYFNDGSYRKFYLTDIEDLYTSKKDAEGVEHADYQYQHVTTKNNKYVYDLSTVDSINFARFDEEQAEKNYVEAMPDVIEALSDCETISDAEKQIATLRNIEGVSDVWSDGHQLYVEIAQGEVIPFHFGHSADLEEDWLQDNAIQRRLRSFVALLEGNSSIKGGYKPKVVIANQQYYDKTRNYNERHEKLINQLEACGFDADYVDKPTVDFFYEDHDPQTKSIYDYDLILLLTHGGYYAPWCFVGKNFIGQSQFERLKEKCHVLLTGEVLDEIKAKSENDEEKPSYADKYKKLKEWREGTKYQDVSDMHINYTYILEGRVVKGKMIKYWVAHPIVTEFFFRDISDGKFPDNSILFNSACESLKGDMSPSYSLADQFFSKNLGIYIGYTETNNLGNTAGIVFLEDLLEAGKSIGKYLEDLPQYVKEETVENIRNSEVLSEEGKNKLLSPENKWHGAELEMLPENGDMLQRFLFPTYTIDLGDEKATDEYYKQNSVTIEGVATLLDFDRTDAVKVGFMYGTDSNSLDHDGIASKKSVDDNELGNCKFKLQLTERVPGVTYYYQAYTYDGLYYNKGDICSFKIEAPPVICPDDHHPHLIDLGLPSGTKWSCCNVDAESPEGFGGFYAWGETEEKAFYSWGNYIHCDASRETCHDLGADIAGTEYDVAHVKWGGDWKLPSLDQIKELLDNCNSEWTKVKGVGGRMFTSPNGNRIFLPAVGCRTALGTLENGANYWSSTQNPSSLQNTIALRFNSDGTMWDDSSPRYYGCSIRPVYDENMQTIKLKVEPTSIDFGEVEVGKSASKTFTLTNEGTGALTVTIDDTEFDMFSVAESNQPLSLAAGESRTLTVTFTPKEEKAIVGTITFRNDVNSEELKLGLLGKGIPATEPHTPAGLEAVDLGLPSGTLWANMNVGANAPEEYGSYFAWGETEEKDVYDWSTYFDSDFNRYNLESGLRELLPEDDAATANWGSGWQMPSKEQIDELIDSEYTTAEWTTQGGVEGRLITSKSNGNSIFLPAAGCRSDTGLDGAGSYGDYWSRSLTTYYSADGACDLYFYSDYVIGSSDYCHRRGGRSVRPVNIGSLHLQLSINSLNLKTGRLGTVDITFGSGSYTVVSSATDVATVTVDGSILTIKADGEGIAVITVTDNKTGETATIEVTIQAPTPIEAVDLGLPSGTKWANMNVGATAPEDYGAYYAWGETEEKDVYDWSTYIHCDGSAETCHDLGSDIAGTEYDVAHVKWGGDWQMPRYNQFDELLRYCTYEWTTINGVSGGKYTGPNGNSIFLPAAGNRYYEDLENAGSRGEYWWSTQADSYFAWELGFGSNFSSLGHGSRLSGQSVRPVITPKKEETTTPAALEAVDLGLPSGTKWANMNVGAESPEDYGGYYAWGETEEKDYYDWSTYIHCDGSAETCHDLGSDIAGKEYDVAHVKWGGDWHMPTLDQIKELLDNTTSTWTTQNGVNGMLFTGTNGNSIFLPASDSRWVGLLFNAGSLGDYWSSTQEPSDSDCAYGFSFDSSGAGWYGGSVRYPGLSVRPVNNGNLHFQLSINSLNLKTGRLGTVDITFGSGSYTVVSSATDVATVTVDGSMLTIKADGEGIAVITVTDNKTGETATIEVTIQAPTPIEAVDLGLPSGTKWANMNVGAESPEDYGDYYAWGETEEKDVYDLSTYIHCDGSAGTYHDLGADIAGTEYDVAHVKWGGSWRMPTLEQVEELLNNCTSEWTSVNGVYGREFTGPNGGKVFLPAAGSPWVTISTTPAAAATTGRRRSTPTAATTPTTSTSIRATRTGAPATATTVEAFAPLSRISASLPQRMKPTQCQTFQSPCSAWAGSGALALGPATKPHSKPMAGKGWRKIKSNYVIHERNSRT